MVTNDPTRTCMHSSHTSKPVSPAIQITQRKKNASRLLATWERAASQRGGTMSSKSQHPKSRTLGQHYANTFTSNGSVHPHLSCSKSLHPLFAQPQRHQRQLDMTMHLNTSSLPPQTPNHPTMPPPCPNSTQSCPRPPKPTPNSQPTKQSPRWPW